MAGRLDIGVVLVLLFTLLGASLPVNGHPTLDHQDKLEPVGRQRVVRSERLPAPIVTIPRYTVQTFTRRPPILTQLLKYLVVHPKVLMSGSYEVVCITLYNMDGPVNISVTLNNIRGEVVGNLEHGEYFMEDPYACLRLSVPEIETPSQKATIFIAGDSEGHINQYMREVKLVMIERPKLETFIETDKPIYKPGQTVKFRILTLDQNLRTDTSQVDKIWVETPSGVRIAQWLSVEGEQGLISLELPMTSDSMLGKWTISVEHHGSRTNTSFEVEEYVLPKFEVTIDGPSNLLVNETSVQYTVCGRYTYGQPVIGAVRAELLNTAVADYVPYEPMEVLVESTGPSGCAELTFDLTEWDLTRFQYALSMAKLKLLVDFTEIVTGIEIHKEDDSCQLINEIYRIGIVSGKRFKPGLPYDGKVKVRTPEGTPVANLPVHVSIYYHEEDDSVTHDTKDVVTNSRGVATFQIEYARQTAINVAAWIPGMKPPRSWGNTIPVSGGKGETILWPYYSPSNTFLKLSLVDGPLEIGSQAKLQVSHNGRDLTSRDFTANFMSKGHLIRPDHVFSQSRPVSVGEGPGYNGLELTFRVTQDMAPITKLLVFFDQDHEIVADSIVFEVEKSLANQVDISFTSDEERPGDETGIDITAAPDSLCGVGVVDKSVYLLGGGQNTIQEKQLWQYLSGLQLVFDSGINNNDEFCRHGCIDDRANTGTTHTIKTECFRQMPGRALGIPSVSIGSEVDTSAAFNDAGVQYMTNLKLATASCPRFGITVDDTPYFLGPGLPGAGPPGTGPTGPTRPEPPRLRSYFPETWLWELVPVNSNGQGHVNLTVPDTITEWVGSGFCISETEGIGISSTSRLQAFQPFFVSYTLPYSVIRGETLPAKVTVFNYMSDCLVVELTLAESENFTLEANEEPVKRICICGSQSSSVEFNIIPNVIGMMPIKVTAESVSDSDGLCGNNFVATLAEAGDAIQKDILVEAEGIKQEVTESKLFCPSESDGGFSWSVSVEPPADIVSDTAWAKITLTGDIMGPTLSNLDSLVQVPFGCGEQNMLTFVPNILAMQYLTSTNQLTPDIAKSAKDNMKLGYQREFNYRHDDGSFSAFGKNDDSGSTWLTAYVVRSFYQASEFIEVDFEDLQISVDWLKSLQRPDGCFSSVGRVCHKDMLGGVDEELTLSAYVVISLLEAGLRDLAVVRGVRCLERGLANTDDTYALAQIAYALSLANSRASSVALTRLHYRGPIDGSHYVSNREGYTSLVSDGRRRPSSADVEITSYVLMAYLERSEPSEVLGRGTPLSWWLVEQRNGNGGFGSTQDTVVGLTALSRFAEYTISDDLDITLTVESSRPQSEWGTSQELEATNENRLLLQQLYMDNIPAGLDFKATGEGCAVLQVSWYYNLYPEEPELPQFELRVKIEDHPQYVDCSRFLVEVCASYTGNDGASNMAVIDFRLQSGYTPDKESLDMLQFSNPILKRYELDGKSVLFYFDEITSTSVCVNFTMVQDIKVKDTKPSFVTVYDYYKTDIKKTQQYSLECSTEAGEQFAAQPPRVWGQITPQTGSENVCTPKIGACDSVDSRFVCEDPREDECSDDYDCPGERRCCHDGCAKACSYPMFPVPQPHLWLSDVFVAAPAECWRDNCPICLEERPDDWVNKYCYSHYAMVAKFKSNSRFKLLNNNRAVSGEEDLDVMVRSTMDESCDCQLEENGRYIVLTNYYNVDLSSREMVVNASTLIFPFKGKYKRQLDPFRCPVH